MVAGLMVTVASGAAIAQDEESDDRARVSFVTPLIDDDGQLWLCTPWADKPPTDLFSLFTWLDVVVDGEASSIGWQVHDGVENPIEDGPRARILRSTSSRAAAYWLARDYFPVMPRRLR
jgi:hypothetical protein